MRKKMQKIDELVGHERPGPDGWLSDVEAMHWRRIVDSKPVEWCTPEIYAPLKQLCRHEALADALAMLRVELMQSYANGDASFLDVSRVMSMELQQTSAISSLCGKLGFSRPALRTATERTESAVASNPWDFESAGNQSRTKHSLDRDVH